MAFKFRKKGFMSHQRTWVKLQIRKSQLQHIFLQSNLYRNKICKFERSEGLEQINDFQSMKKIKSKKKLSNAI